MSDQKYIQASKVLCQQTGAAAGRDDFFESDRLNGQFAADDTLMVVSKRGRIVELNYTGAITWNLLKTPRSLDDLVSALDDRFNVSDADVRSDLQAILDILQKEKLVDAVSR